MKSISLKQELEENCSKQNVLQLAKIAASNPSFVDEIFTLTEDDSFKKNWRAAWILDHINQIEPEALLPYLNRMTLYLPSTKNEAIQRTYLKIISSHTLPKTNEGILLDTCFNLLNNPATAVAVRVWCMDILTQFSKRYPEIVQELKPSLENIAQTGTAGEKNRALKKLKILDKES